MIKKIEKIKMAVKIEGKSIISYNLIRIGDSNEYDIDFSSEGRLISVNLKYAKIIEEELGINSMEDYGVWVNR